MGALKNGIKKIIIPYDNYSDVEELPKEIKDNIKYIGVKIIKKHLSIYLVVIMMKNKEIYIEEQISLVHFNKLLITEDTDSMLKELLNDYDILEIIDIVENYLNKDEFIYFISLFDNLREKLINFIEVVIFAHKRYIKYKSDIDSEYMYEDTLTDLLNMLEFVTKIKEVNKEEYREILLNYKGIPNDNGGLFNLQISYMLDEDVLNI